MKKHEHSGSSNKSIENPFEVLKAADLKAGDTVLDLGAGQGYLSLAASEIVGAQGKVYALDKFEDSIKGLKKTVQERGIQNIETVTADAVQEIPLPEGSVTFCLMANVLHGFVANNELRDVMNNLKRVLKKEGRIIIVDFRKIPTPFGPPLAIRLAPENVDSTISPYGFRMIKIFDAGPYHYGMILRQYC